MRTDMPGKHAPRREPARVCTGEYPTGDVQPLLHQIRFTLVHLSDLGEDTVIDLRNLSQSYNPTKQTTRGHI